MCARFQIFLKKELSYLLYACKKYCRLVLCLLSCVTRPRLAWLVHGRDKGYFMREAVIV